MSPQTFCKILKLSLSADNSINGRTLAARLPDKLMRPWSGPTSQYVAWSAMKESGARSGSTGIFKLDHFPPIPFLHRPTLDEIEATIYLVVELHPIWKICSSPLDQDFPHFRGETLLGAVKKAAHLCSECGTVCHQGLRVEDGRSGWWFVQVAERIPSWWLNQPIWKICSSNWESFPHGSGWK